MYVCLATVIVYNVCTCTHDDHCEVCMMCEWVRGEWMMCEWNIEMCMYDVWMIAAFASFTSNITGKRRVKPQMNFIVAQLASSK